MKKSIFSLIAIATLFLGACKKDKNDNPNNDGGKDTYQPLTAGSVWKYRDTFTFGDEAPTVDTTVTTMTAGTKALNGKTYHVATSLSDGETSQTYIGLNNNVYSTILDEIDADNADFEYLDESKPKDATWQKDFQFEDESETINARLKTTVVEKNISKTVLGKNFNNVIHTKVDMQFKNGAEYTTVASVAFYIAKGVGIISMVSVNDNIGLSFKSELFNYTIK